MMYRARTASRPEIDQTNNQWWSHGVVPADPADDPEVPTTPEWRKDMIRTRKLKGLTQEQLGRRVGTSQNIVSLIESGKLGSSAFVLRIARVLAIAAPQFHGDAHQELWAKLGQQLQSRSPRQFRRALALVESMLEDDDGEVKHPAPHGNDAPRK